MYLSFVLIKQLKVMGFLLSYMPIFALVFVIPFVILIKTRKKNNVPPGPSKLPFIGNLHQLGDLPHLSLESLANDYGPLMFLQLGSIPTVVISSADMARQIFKAHDTVSSGRPVLYAANKLSYDCATVSFAPYGDYWREIKKIMVSELLGGKRVQAWQAVRDEEVMNMIETIAYNNNNNNYHSSSGLIINLSEMMLSLVNNVVCRVAFGKKYDGGKMSFHEMLRETQELLGGFCLADFFPWLGWLNKFNGLDARLDKCFREFDNFYDKVIEDHLDPNRPRAEFQHNQDVVDVLLQVQKDPNQAMALSNNQIKAVLTDMFIAGTDTSAASLEWIMAELMKNPTVMKKAQDEVREVVSKERKGKVEENDLSKLVYLKWVIKEGFRLHPPAPLLVPRETTESFEIEGYNIPPKTRVFVNAKMIGKDPKYWENPNEFQPKRFMNSSVDYRGHNFELLPFGFGRRGCPGINFSVLLIELVLANLLYCFDWELPDGMKREDLDMEEALGITMHKKVPLCLSATPFT